ncbi:ribonuclease P protein component [Gordonia sp. CPCC 205515]|uniref:ribonuclease P protein component n=1 Tax=Gordonia sp. CPCC 205515 TaxID=3140791 RepID=UPI003AF4018D
MVAAVHRISRGSDFNRTLKTGVRVSTRDLTVHVAPVTDLVTVGGPWLGLIVSKSVGNAVVRHRVARRLRAAFAARLPEFPRTEVMVVLRARPSAATVDSTDLADQLSGALRHRRVRALVDGSADRVRIPR